jgi:adenosine deaminase
MSVKNFITPEFIRAIPKSDLHLHLDGSLRLPTLIELSKKAGVKLPSFTESGLRKLVFKDSYKNLPDYLHGFMYTCAVLLDRDNLSRVAQELVEDNIAEGVRYIEVRFAPQLHVTAESNMSDVMRAVARGLEAGAKAHNATQAVREGRDVPFYSGIIVCGMRRFKKGMSPYFADLLRLMVHRQALLYISQVHAIM